MDWSPVRSNRKEVSETHATFGQMADKWRIAIALDVTRVGLNAGAKRFFKSTETFSASPYI